MKKEQIKISALQKAFPTPSGDRHTILHLDSLSINEGEFFCILGSSGCGKTTLLNILSGFLKPDKGEVSIDGENVTQPHSSRIHVFQEYGLFPWQTVLQNVMFGLKMGKKSKEENMRIARQFIELVGLQGCEEHYPSELSGGMKQRTALARALAVDAIILFMDEPFGALDSLTRLSMQKELERIWLGTKKTVVFVTHNVDEALALADRVAIMSSNPGKITKIIEVPLERPRNPMNESFLDLKKEIYSTLGIS